MLTCKEYTELKKKELKKYIEEKGLKPCLVVIQVGDRPESNSYIRGKMRDCEEVGIECRIEKLVDDISMEELVTEIITFNTDNTVDGIILQLPVPDHIDVSYLQELIDIRKDVDGFNVISDFNPCTPKGVIDYLKFIDYKFEGKDALVIGRSDIVGKPLARMLTDLDCTVTLAHSKTNNIRLHAIDADIIFSCMDKIEWFDRLQMTVMYNSNIIDIGLGISERDKKLHGNFASEYIEYLRNVNPNRILISGIGGVGLLTRLALLENVVRAAELQKG